MRWVKLPSGRLLNLALVVGIEPYGSGTALTLPASDAVVESGDGAGGPLIVWLSAEDGVALAAYLAGGEIAVDTLTAA